MRPPTWSSSAIWAPDWALPTTRIPPSGRDEGFRYWLLCSCVISDERFAAAAGDLWQLLEPGRDHYGVSRNGPLRRHHPVAVAVHGLDGRHPRVVPNGEREPIDVPLEVGDGLVPRHEGIWLRPVVCRPRHLERPVGGDQGEGVPALVAPDRRCVCGLLQHDVLAPLLMR